MTHQIQFGIEEELFLAETGTREAPTRSVKAFHDAASARFGDVEREMLQNQIEIASKPSTSFAEARDALAGLRRGLAEIGREHGLAVFAAGTHPTALRHEQRSTDKKRYRDMLEDLQLVGKRSVVCGLHVHVEVPRPDARVDLMNRIMPYLPVLLALSTSSPFWEGKPTGLSGYRMRIYAELPRTGLPELFDDEADYARYVEGMIEAGAVKDASYFWWDVRPSIKYPTLELRVADSCTRLGDTLTIAALARCLVRLLDRRKDLHAGHTGASRGFVMENLWRVQRMGTRATLIGADVGAPLTLAQAVDAMLDLIAEDADALGCTAEVSRAREIVADGSSADAQIAIYQAALSRGCDEGAAVRDVIDWLARETEGVGAA